MCVSHSLLGDAQSHPGSVHRRRDFSPFNSLLFIYFHIPDEFPMLFVKEVPEIISLGADAAAVSYKDSGVHLTPAEFHEALSKPDFNKGTRTLLVHFIDLEPGRRQSRYWVGLSTLTPKQHRLHQHWL